MSSSWCADSIAVAAWFANARSACSRSGVGTSRSTGSSAQMNPQVSPARSYSGTSSQWRFHAYGPRPLRSVG